MYKTTGRSSLSPPRFRLIVGRRKGSHAESRASATTTTRTTRPTRHTKQTTSSCFTRIIRQDVGKQDEIEDQAAELERHRCFKVGHHVRLADPS